ncbi:myosin-binding protein 1-like [Phragmites australis]|uniref:myosin-binding protein 1-like n=1 Tax=Phragmites australis TaxID=29695 RepID=UPI002D77AB19|nr:myosin-binding protein 1-like [Phragmites australis]
MAAQTRSTSQRFWYMLSYACSELCLIILLYVAAVASYAATRWARICRLKAPCLVCSRLDHALHGKPWFSVDLVCAAHRSEISSLSYCKSHNQLARSDDLCKRCLLACTGLVACPALGVSEEVNSRSRSRSKRLCSCCSESFKNARNALKLSQSVNDAESSDTVNVVEETNERSQFAASDSNVAMPSKVIPEEVPADHPKEKTFVVGIEEVNESDGSPGSDGQSTKDNGPSTNAVTAKPVTYRSAAPTRIAVDRNSSVKNAFIVSVNLPSPRPSEIISARDNNSTTQQEVKALLSQMSSARAIDSSSREGAPSPGINIQTDESRRPSLERNYSVLEPTDGNLAEDIEGESSVENLKKHLELNKKSMAALYKELDEERSASAVAASQTMAMINRLQEEKAAMQMEALQYLRMMEEQADHDHEAIQNLHDLLTEREKELLDMDAELASCRRLLQNEPFNVGRFDGSDTRDDINVAFELLDGKGFVKSTMAYFEDEKAYILESLSRLEENLCISTNRLASDVAKNRQENILLEDHTRDDGQYLENSQLDGRSPPMSRRHLSSESTSIQQHDENESIKENHKDKCSCSPLDNDKMSDVKSIKNEISLLNTRLEALEADQKFLKQVLGSLKCGSDGLQCVQEITSHLVELRRVVTR